MSSQDREFRMELDLDARAEAVWDAISNPEDIMRWFAIRAESKPGQGGEMNWNWGDVHWPLRIKTWEPGKRLTLAYDFGGAENPEETKALGIDFKINALDGGKTRLRLIHSGFGPEAKFDEEYDGVSRGWTIELESLRLYLENHGGRDRQLAFASREFECSLAEAWAKITGRDGFYSERKLAEHKRGESFVIKTPAGDVFEGETLVTFDHEFAGLIKTPEPSFFRIATERCGGKSLAWLWVSRYDGDEAAAKTQVGRFEDMLDAVLGQAADRKTAEA